MNYKWECYLVPKSILGYGKSYCSNDAIATCQGTTKNMYKNYFPLLRSIPFLPLKNVYIYIQCLYNSDHNATFEKYITRNINKLRKKQNIFFYDI